MKIRKLLLNTIVILFATLGFICLEDVQNAKASNTNPSYLRLHNWYTRRGNIYARWHFSPHGAFYAIKKLNNVHWVTKYKILGTHYSINHGNAKGGWNVFGYKNSDAATYFRYKKALIDGKQMNTFQEFEGVTPGSTGSNSIWIYTPSMKYANKMHHLYTKGWAW